MSRLLLLAVALAVAAPVTADTRVRVTGVLTAPTGTALGVPLAAGDRFRAVLTLGLPSSSSVIAPLGATGQGRIHLGTLKRLDIVFGTAAGDFTMALKPGFLGNSPVYDNGTSAIAPVRVDYAGVSVPTAIAFGGVNPYLATDLALPAGVFAANFGFGRFAAVPVGSPPGTLPVLLTSTDLPDFATFFGAPGATYIGNITFRSGNAFSAAQFNALPFSDFSIGSLQVTLLPEPGTWALLIAGFGAVGVAARRRRAATPAARL